MRPWIPLLPLLLLAAALPAGAHVGGVSHLDGLLGPRGLSLYLVAEQRDLTQALFPEVYKEKQDLTLDPARRERIAAYLTDRVLVRGPGGYLPAIPGPLVREEGFGPLGKVGIELRFEVPAAATQLVLDVRLFQDEDPRHRTLASVRGRGETWQQIFTRQTPSLTLALPPPPAPDRAPLPWPWLAGGGLVALLLAGRWLRHRR